MRSHHILKHFELGAFGWVTVLIFFALLFWTLLVYLSRSSFLFWIFYPLFPRGLRGSARISMSLFVVIVLAIIPTNRNKERKVREFAWVCSGSSGSGFWFWQPLDCGLTSDTFRGCVKPVGEKKWSSFRFRSGSGIMIGSLLPERNSGEKFCEKRLYTREIAANIWRHLLPIFVLHFQGKLATNIFTKKTYAFHTNHETRWRPDGNDRKGDRKTSRQFTTPSNILWQCVSFVSLSSIVGTQFDKITKICILGSFVPSFCVL